MLYCTKKGFPGGSGSEVKASARNAGDQGSIPGSGRFCNAGDPGSIPRSGRSSGEGNGNPLHYSCLENPMDGGDR